jgi:hypothetical protein
MSTPVFNPDLPVDDSLIAAGELRDQFNSLNNRCEDVATNVENRCFKPSEVAPLVQTISNPPTQAQAQAIQDKLNALLATLNT